MRTDELIVRYGLEEEVSAFVNSRCVEMSSGFEVAFQGHCTGCCNKQPHVPHKTGSYNTVRFGELDNYCRGVEGDGIEILVVKCSGGSAEYPSIFKARVKDAPQNTKEVVELPHTGSPKLPPSCERCSCQSACREMIIMYTLSLCGRGSDWCHKMRKLRPLDI